MKQKPTRLRSEHDIEKQVEDTLNSLDGLSRAQANPFLFTRVEARLRQGTRSAWEQVTYYISRPAVVLAVVVFVIVSNAAVLYKQVSPEEMVVDQNQLALIEEYSQTTSSYYDVENPEP